MSIVFHILGKDLRWLWREIVLFLLVTAGWTWQQAHPEAWTWSNGKSVLPILFFVLWFFIVVRVVQGEALVGNREFWTTRPYEWDSLLMAKAIFLVLVLNVPLLASQVYQLFSAGFSFKWTWIPGLVFLGLAFAACLTIPAFALAAVTESLVQWLLAVAGLAIFAVVISWLPWDRLPPALNAADQATGAIAILMAGALVAFAIVKQYSRRKQRTAIALLAAAVLASIAIATLTPIGTLRDICYPHPSEPSPIRLALQNSGSNNSREYMVTGFLPFKPALSIPIEGNTTTPDTVALIEGARLNLKGDGGWSWQSAWSKEAAEFSADGYQSMLVFDIPNQELEQLAAHHPAATVEVALAVYKLAVPRRIETGAASFEIPGVGLCHWDDPLSLSKDAECSAPLRAPDVVLSRLDSSENTCPADDPKEKLPPGHSAIGFIWDESPLPADFDLRPVRTINFRSYAWSPGIPDPHNKGYYRQASLCRGTPLTLRIGSLSSRMRVGFNLGSLGSPRIEKPNPEEVGFRPAVE